MPEEQGRGTRQTGFTVSTLPQTPWFEEKKSMGAFHFGVIKILHLCWWPKVLWKLWDGICACHFLGLKTQTCVKVCCSCKDLASQHFQVKSLQSCL